MAELTFTNNKIDGAITTGERYQSKINTAGTLTTGQLAGEVAKNLKESSTFVEGLLKEITKVTADHLAKGERVLLDGLCHIELTGEGSFATEDAPWDPDEHRIAAKAVPYAAIRNATAALVPTNTLPTVTIQLLGAQDAITKEQNALTVGNTLLCQGKNIQVTAAHADEGFYLVKGTESFKGTLTDNTAGTADVTFPGLTAAEAGEGWTLEIRGRAGLGTNRMLVTARIADFTVKAA